VLAIDVYIKVCIVIVVVGPEVQIYVVFLSVHGVFCVVAKEVESLRIWLEWGQVASGLGIR
jgi:hypothetical protein